MKRILIAALAATIVLTGLTACGSKKDAERDYDDTSRVLYTDNDTETEEDTEETETEKDSEKKDEKKSSDSDKKKDESSKKSESKKSESKKSDSSKAASSKAASSKKVTTYNTNSASKKTASSAAASSNNSSEAASSEKTSSDETDTAAQTDTDTNTDSAAADTETETDSEATDTAADAEPVTVENDLRLSTDGIYVDLNDDMDFVLENLGEADNVTTAGACLGGGDIKLYTYDGFEITAYPKSADSEDYIVASIKLTDSSVETERGVHIGTPIEEALNAYGKDYETLGASTYKYKTSDGSYIMISAEDDVVAEIIISLDTTTLG